MAVKENIVVFPFMAQGHIIPFLALALKIEQEKDLSVTFVSTPLNVKNLKSSLPQNSTISLVEIPYDVTEHGFPAGCETAESLPLHHVIRFIQTSVSLKPAFSDIISDLVGGGTPPLCVVSDMFFSWSAEVAHGLGVPHAIFFGAGGYGFAMYHSIMLNLPHLNQESSDDVFQVPGFPDGYTFPVSELPEPLRSGERSFEFLWNMFGEWKKTDAMLFNTAEEIDGVGLRYFRENFPCRVIAIGPIISNVGSKARAGEEEAKTTWDICRDWLNQKAKNSVLYVAFGSQNTPSQSEMEHLETALEASQVDYIWGNRMPSNFVSSDERNKWIEKWNSNGDIEHRKNGLVLHKWAPQIDILSHTSTGAFLSHCGWNSAMEALSNGVPILAWPLGAEQHYNAKMLEEELMVSVKVASHEVGHEELLKKIEMVMKEEKGNEIRKRALNIKEVMEMNYAFSISVMDEFLNVAMLARKDLNSHPGTS